jgi:tetratricopeptide (TPR) repeat protein
LYLGAMNTMRYLALMLAGASAFGQTKPAPPAPAKVAALLETGHCGEALPKARRAYGRSTAEDRRRIGVSAVKCAMTLNEAGEAAGFVELLNHDFPRAADILYLTAHVYSDLAVRASQSLLMTHPDSYQVHQLNAEALETQGKWEDAAREYRAVLEKNPNLAGIHFRLGRMLLSKPESATSREEAAREMEAELSVNPGNAGAEFVLAELARQAGRDDEAIAHFTRATHNDVMFADAYIGLGRALLGMGKAEEAIAPLRTAVKLQPDNPVTHFQLATAYRRVGRGAEADRELAAHRAAADRATQTSNAVKRAVSGVDEKAPR